MALTDIITKIKDDATTEADRIIAAAKEEAAKILDDANAKAEDILETGKEAAHALGHETHERTLSGANYQAKFASQGFQASLIERTFKEVESRLAKLPEGAYHDMVVKRAKTLPEKEGALTVSKERKDETIKALKEAGVTTKDASEADLLGGFILETKSAEYNNSIREIVRQAKESFVGDAARALTN